jgi:hypothetical protein
VAAHSARRAGARKQLAQQAPVAVEDCEQLVEPRTPIAIRRDAGKPVTDRLALVGRQVFPTGFVMPCRPQ